MQFLRENGPSQDSPRFTELGEALPRARRETAVARLCNSLRALFLSTFERLSNMAAARRAACSVFAFFLAQHALSAYFFTRQQAP